PETYGLAGLSMDETERMLAASPPEGPFDPRFSIPFEVARAMPFFQRYWADGTAGEGEAWRRIAAAWLDGLADLAIRLDDDTNNSSLALAIELDDGDVLLFAADAQVGNWLSWHDLTWTLDGDRVVTGGDLVARTVLYKVGHHGSHNATLRERGLERMARLRVAMVPVDQETARRRGWTRMPLPELMDRLGEKAIVLRSDEAAPAGIADLIETPLYFELSL